MVLKLNEQLDPLHRIETKIEFEIVAWMHSRGGILCRRPDDANSPLNIGLRHPVAFFVRQFAGKLLLGVARAAGLHLANLRLNLEAAQLARGGARQVLLPDVVAQDALGGRQVRRDVFHVVADDLAHVHDFLLPQHIEVRHDDGVQALGNRIARRALQPHDTDLFDPGTLQVVALDFFGVNVFAGAEDDNFLLPAGDEEIAARVAVAEIARVQPAIANDLGGCFGTVVIALHDDGPANGDLADHVTGAILGRFGVDDFGFIAGKRRADRTDHVRLRRRDQCSAGGFGQAIGLQHVEAKGVKVAADGHVEAGAAGDQVAHLGTEQGVNFFEEQLARIQSYLAAEARKRQHRPERSPDQPVRACVLPERRVRE